MSEKWIAIVGSPRKRKNIDIMVDYVIEGLKEKIIEKIRNYRNF